ncbi:MAG TPA: helix-turn-helix transcriptional regulator [Bacteroidales bacterium]|nr:helix-turn-helix transcriptional regulator [Bacteroidales bacterium]
MKDRLLALMKAESLTPSQFADELAIQRSAVSHLVSGRNLPSYDVLVKILNRFPEINPEWLLLGKGEMYKKPKTGSLFDQPEHPSETGSVRAEPDAMQELHSSDPENYGSKTSSGAQKNPGIKEILLLFSDNTFQRFIPQQEKLP